MLAEMMPGLIVPLLLAAAAIMLRQFFRPLRWLTTRMGRWLLGCSAIGLLVPLFILSIYPPNTDAALNATLSRFLWPTHMMLMAADSYTPTFGVAFVIGMSIGANILAYLGIGLGVWAAVSWTRRLLA